MEPTLKYHPDCSDILTWPCDPGQRQCLAGSLTGAAASQKVTEAPKGSLRLVGNQPPSVKAVSQSGVSGAAEIPEPVLTAENSHLLQDVTGVAKSFVCQKNQLPELSMAPASMSLATG